MLCQCQARRSIRSLRLTLRRLAGYAKCCNLLAFHWMTASYRFSRALRSAWSPKIAARWEHLEGSPSTSNAMSETMETARYRLGIKDGYR